MVRGCAQVKIAEAGALELLLTMVPSSSLETRRQIARALANLSVNQANKDRLAELDGVSVLKVTLALVPTTHTTLALFYIPVV